MKKHYSNEHSSAEVVEPTSLPPSLKGVLEMVRVFTAPNGRKQGFATELVKSICSDADIEGVVLMLSPKTFSTGGLTDLQAWYERFGFQVIQRKPVVLMARMPQVFKVKMTDLGAASSEVVNGR
jgi:GNAT superfamily N-acetyltransferase